MHVEGIYASFSNSVALVSTLICDPLTGKTYYLQWTVLTNGITVK